MSDNRLSNLGKDLTKARQQALLIEVLQSDLESWAGQSPDVFRTVCDASAAVFDADVEGGKTNVLMVGEAEDLQPSSIFGTLLGSLDNEFDDQHKREILAKLAGFGLNQSLGSAVGDAVADNLNVGAEKMMDYLAEWRGGAPDFLTPFFEAGVEEMAEGSGDLLETIGETGAEAITGQFSSDDNIYLSRPARKRLKELAPRLSEEATSHETLQLALEMLLVTAQGAPKVIVVKDPLRLDDASLALLAMLVSLEKDLRQLAHTETPVQGRAQTAGMSVVLTFTGPQPHDTVENKETAEKQRAISRLRMMASRYSLLERLDSDIPVPAVRASTFVGREAELKTLWQDWNTLCKQPGAAKQTWALIKGEPGTGKTALANRFIQQIRSDANNPNCLSIPTLRMLNQTGHSAEATGLASLKNSIVDELRRLNLVYQENVGWFARFGQQMTEDAQRWARDARSDDPEAKNRTRGRIGKVISRLVGVDAAVELTRSARNWSKQDEMRSMRGQEFGQSSKASHKDEQYELLQEALQELRKLASKCVPSSKNQPTENAAPLLLLIDDLQWVDDFTAEFLLNEWPADMPVYIIATARGSDSFTTTGDSNTYQAMNRHRNRLFAELGLIEARPADLERESDEEKEEGKVEKHEKNISLASSVDLRGMDQPMLANLIKLTYASITQHQAEQFAAGVIKNLSGENSAPDAITLFAIETLNVISDPQFYRGEPKLPRAIEPLPGTDRYRFRVPDNISLTEALDKIFKNLAGTYQASYLIEAGQSRGGDRFNLASYAILEERLHLIEHYFGENGGTVRYSLLFSALLGSPFHSELVQHVIEGLKKLAPEDHPELGAVIRELRDRLGGSLGPTGYELLEGAYELIRRLEENTLQGNRYVHQHSLLQQFLLGQLTQLLNRLYPDSQALEVGIQHLVTQVKNLGREWFKDLAAAEDRKLSADELKETADLQFLVAVYGYWYRLMKVRTSKVGDWGWQYFGWLNELAGVLNKWGHLKESLPLYQKALSILSEGDEDSPDRWARGYSRTLYRLGEALLNLDRLEEARTLLEEAASIMRVGYESSPEHWALDYANTLNAFLQTPPQEQEPLLLKKALSIMREGYNSSKERRAKEDYAIGLHNLSITIQNRGWAELWEESIELKKMVLPIFKEGYEISPERWGEHYATALSMMSKILQQETKRWEGDVLVTVDGDPEEALPLLEKAVSIMREGYESSPKRWADKLAPSLMSLAKFRDTTLDEGAAPKEAYQLIEEAVSVMRQGYNSSPERWAREFAFGLSQLATELLSRDKLDDAIPRYKEALSVFRERYEAYPKRYAAFYNTSLMLCAGVLERQGNLAEALDIHREALSFLRKQYETPADEGAQRYVEKLLEVARILTKLSCWEEVMQSYAEALLISHEGYEMNSSNWEKTYSGALRNANEFFKKLDLTEEMRAIELELKRVNK